MNAWAARRAEFMAKFDAGDPATLKAAWQRFYFKGQYSGGAPAEREHLNKLRVAAPVDMRGKPTHGPMKTDSDEKGVRGSAPTRCRRCTFFIGVNQAGALERPGGARR